MISPMMEETLPPPTVATDDNVVPHSILNIHPADLDHYQRYMQVDKAQKMDWGVA